MQYEIGAECNDGSHTMLQTIDAKCNKTLCERIFERGRTMGTIL